MSIDMMTRAEQNEMLVRLVAEDDILVSCLRAKVAGNIKEFKKIKCRYFNNRKKTYTEATRLKMLDIVVAITNDPDDAQYWLTLVDEYEANQ